MRCAQCASEETGKFCGTCGAPLLVSAPSDPTEETVIRVGAPSSGDEAYDVSEIPDDGYTAWRTQGSTQSGYLPPVQQGYPDASGYPPTHYTQPEYAQPHYAQPHYAQPHYAQPEYAQPGYPTDYEKQYADPDHIGDAETAPLGPRFGAAVVDGIIHGAFTFGIYAALFTALTWWYDTQDWRGPAIVLVLVPSFLVALLLFNGLYRVGARGQSWGKSILRVAVVDRDTGATIGLGRATVRALLYLIPLVPLTCFLDRSGELRTWADAAAGSRVVRA